MGLEPSLYCDQIKLMSYSSPVPIESSSSSNNYFRPYAFVPCGHMSSEVTCKYWSKIKMPQGQLQCLLAMCPFCAKPLDTTQPFVKLIFQEGY